MSMNQTTWHNFVRQRAEAKFAEAICTGAVVPKTDAEDTMALLIEDRAEAQDDDCDSL